MAVKTRRPGDLVEGFVPASELFGTSPDPIREKAERAHPPDSAELEAELAVEKATDGYNDFLRAASRRQHDIGERTGTITGFIELSDLDREEYETVRETLAAALRRRNGLHHARKALIAREIAAEGAKEALLAQARYQKQRGIEVADAPKLRSGIVAS
jgi:hypothetical protein